MFTRRLSRKNLAAFLLALPLAGLAGMAGAQAHYGQQPAAQVPEVSAVAHVTEAGGARADCIQNALDRHRWL